MNRKVKETLAAGDASQRLVIHENFIKFDASQIAQSASAEDAQPREI